MDAKQEYEGSQSEQPRTEEYGLEKAQQGETLSLKESDAENSINEAVRLGSSVLHRASDIFEPCSFNYTLTLLVPFPSQIHHD
jgi:hypothetical protein